MPGWWDRTIADYVREPGNNLWTFGLRPRFMPQSPSGAAAIIDGTTAQGANVGASTTAVGNRLYLVPVVIPRDVLIGAAGYIGGSGSPAIDLVRVGLYKPLFEADDRFYIEDFPLLERIWQTGDIDTSIAGAGVINSFSFDPDGLIVQRGLYFIAFVSFLNNPNQYTAIASAPASWSFFLHHGTYGALTAKNVGLYKDGMVYGADWMPPTVRPTNLLTTVPRAFMQMLREEPIS